MKKPCLGCGEPADTTRCPDCKPPVRDRDRDHAHWNGARWKRLSARLRRLMPFCETCGTTQNLTVDHRVPVAARHDWTYEVPNLTVLCRRCNGRKGAQMPDQHVIDTIEQQITTRRRRQLTPRGETPPRVGHPSTGGSEFASHTPGGYA